MTDYIIVKGIRLEKGHPLFEEKLKEHNERLKAKKGDKSKDKKDGPSK